MTGNSARGTTAATTSDSDRATLESVKQSSVKSWGGVDEWDPGGDGYF